MELNQRQGWGLWNFWKYHQATEVHCAVSGMWQCHQLNKDEVDRIRPMRCFRQILLSSVCCYNYKTVFWFIVWKTLKVKVLTLFLIYVHLWSWWKLNISVGQPTPDPWASVPPHLKKDQEREHTQCAKLNNDFGQEPRTCSPVGALETPPKDVKFRADFGPQAPTQVGETRTWVTTRGQSPLSGAPLGGETFWDQLLIIELNCFSFYIEEIWEPQRSWLFPSIIFNTCDFWGRGDKEVLHLSVDQFLLH